MKSLKRALEVLTLFSSEKSELSVSDIARRMDMNVSTVSRILSTFGTYHILEKSPMTQRYKLGKAVMELAGNFLSQMDLMSTALPYMKELNVRTDETVGIYLLDEDQVFCLYQLESSQEIRRIIRLGAHSPIHAGATGKLFLAYLPPEKREQVLRKTGLHSITPSTIVDRNMLEKELEKIRKQGFSVSFEERIPFSAAISVPLGNFQSNMVAALTISGPVGRYSYAKVEEYATLTKEIAAKISEDLGSKMHLPF